MQTPAREDIDLYGRTLTDSIVPGLGVPEDILEEDPTSLHGEWIEDGPPAASPLKGITPADLHRWFELFGAALEIRVEVEVSEPPEPWVAKVSDHDEPRLKALIQAADALIDAQLHVVLHLDKKPLVGRLREDLGPEGPQPAEIFLYFSAAALETNLSARNEGDFEATFQPARDMGPRPLLILVADVSGRLQGPFCAVMGGPEIDRAADFLRQVPSLEPLRKRWGIMAKECNWDARPLCLTPDLLELREQQQPYLRGCRGELVRLQNRLVIQFLANWSRQLPTGLTCELRGENRTVNIAVGDERRSSALFALYFWAYGAGEQAVSRLEIVRHVIALREWPPVPDLGQLAAVSWQLLELCEYQLRLLIDRNVFNTFQERQKIASMVLAYTDSVSAGIQNLSKEMVSHTYQTVGFLVGVALAYILDPSLGAAAAGVGTVLYIAYILFIYFFYVRALNTELAERRAEITNEKTRLGRERIGALQELFAGAERRDGAFRRRFWTVTAIYAGLVLVAALLGSWLALERPALWGSDPRKRALDAQAERFEELGYQHLRVDLPGHDVPGYLMEADTGTALLPDLTAVGPDDRLRVLVFVPCGEVDAARTTERLRRFRRASAAQHAELQLITQAVCQGAPGDERLGARLAAAGMGGLRIWPW